jgi:transposase
MYRNRRQQAQQLRAAGKSLREIAKELNTTIAVVKGWVSSEREE